MPQRSLFSLPPPPVESPMPPGRPANLDKRISDLVGQLRKALLAKEAAKAEATVGAQMQSLLTGLSRGGGSGSVAPIVVEAAAPAAAAPKTSKKRRGWSPAARAAAKARMKAYWAKRKGGRAKAAVAAAAKG